MHSHNVLKSFSEFLGIKFACSCSQDIRIIILPLPYFMVKLEESLEKAVICLLREKSACHTINIYLQKSSFGKSEYWNTCSQGFKWSDSGIFFLWHEKSSGIFIDFHNCFVGYFSEEFYCISCYFLKFCTLCTISDDFQRNSDLCHDTDDSIDLLEWC